MRKLSPVFAFLLLTTLSAACEPAPSRSSRPVHCEVIVDPPEKAENAAKIVGRVRFTCDEPGAEKLTLKMQLQQRDGDQWHTVASATHTVKGAATHASGWERQSRTIELKCADGTYRTVVDWSRVSRGDTKRDNLISGVNRDPCHVSPL
jgi:hypothetical protein